MPATRATTIACRARPWPTPRVDWPQQRKFLARLEAIPRGQLSRAEQVNYDIFGRLRRDAISEYEFHSELMPITNRSGFHIEFPELPREVPLATVRDYDNYIARLRAFDRYVDDHIELMREGIRLGYDHAGRGVDRRRQGDCAAHGR